MTEQETFSNDPRIKRVMGVSESWWPPRPSAKGKPNVVIVLVDDVGFADVGCFGAEIDTPVLDSLAAGGVRFANFHVNPMCSPTRASLLTGRNCHTVGFGHVANSDPGFPGYWSELPEDVATIAETFRAAGYGTMLSGKWHLARDADLSASGPKHSWPCQRGFDRFYGILDAFTNAFHPHYLVEDNHVVEVDRYPDDYYLTDDLTTKAISMIRELKATDPEKPFLLYLAHPAAHAPLLAKPADLAKYWDRYRQGWDHLRAERFARQRALGLLPDTAELADRNHEPGASVPAWDDLTPEHQLLYARYMAVFAAMVDSIDQNLGRLRDALVESGDWDDTIVVFLSDNGASREGELVGTTSYYTDLSNFGNRIDAPRPSDLARIDLIGSPQVMAHYPQGWAMAGNTPFRLYKTFTYAGGHQVPFVLHWPNGSLEAGAVRPQYQHIIDLLPTLLELTGVPALTERNGAPVQPVQGSSFASVLRDPKAESTRRSQYYELGGQRAMMVDGWEAVTYHEPRTSFTDEHWALFDLAADPTQRNDRSADRPELVAELTRAWHDAAVENSVYPLDEGSGYRWAVRGPEVDRFMQPITIYPGTPTLEPWRSRRLLWMRSYTCTATFDTRADDQGVLVAHGGQGGGYVLFIDDQCRPVYLLNSGRGDEDTIIGEPLAPGSHVVVIEVDALEQFRMNVTLRVDGLVAGVLHDKALLFPMAPFEGIDVGADRRSPVSWDMHRAHGSYPFSGRLHHVRFVPGEQSATAPERYLGMLREMSERFA